MSYRGFFIEWIEQWSQFFQACSLNLSSYKVSADFV
jgi:hypothetical protein